MPGTCRERDAANTSPAVELCRPRQQGLVVQIEPQGRAVVNVSSKVKDAIVAAMAGETPVGNGFPLSCSAEMHVFPDPLSHQVTDQRVVIDRLHLNAEVPSI